MWSFVANRKKALNIIFFISLSPLCRYLPWAPAIQSLNVTVFLPFFVTANTRNSWLIWFRQIVKVNQRKQYSYQFTTLCCCSSFSSVVAVQTISFRHCCQSYKRFLIMHASTEIHWNVYIKFLIKCHSNMFIFKNPIEISSKNPTHNVSVWYGSAFK